MENKQEKINPREYVYQQDSMVEINGYAILDLIMLLESLLKDEIKSESKFKYNYVNEKGNIVKNVKKEEVDSGKLQKIVDFERTILEPNLEYSITEKGLAYAQLKNFLESIHYKNIQEGKAVKYTDLVAMQQPEVAPEKK